MKICTVIGARPQFIKAAAINHVVKATVGMNEVVIHTGQHYDASMSDVFFEELGMDVPKYNLGIGGGSHGSQTGRMIEQLEKVFIEENPDWVLVYGDTNSTLAGSLAAVKLHIPIAHVEAGLRSFNRLMPEEVNRVLTDHISTLLFAPTTSAVENLIREGIDSKKIIKTGDVMLDTTKWMVNKTKDQSSKTLEKYDVQRDNYILATVHRAENTDKPEVLSSIFRALGEISHHIKVILPLHPRTRKAIDALCISAPNGVRIIDPVGYSEMTTLLANAKAVTTDSGGLQKEAFFHKVPCVTFRTETEWVELVKAGWNTLANPLHSDQISGRVLAAVRSSQTLQWPSDLYGDGSAGKHIISCLRSASNT